MKRAPHKADLHKALHEKVNTETLIQTVGLISVVDNKGRYLHWDDIVHRYNSREKAIAHWSLICLAREGVLKPVPRLGHALGPVVLFTLIPSMQKTCSLIDRTCTEAGINDLFHRIGIPETYANDFINEESIASSQLEGASTTRAVARKLLAENRKGRSESELMIIGNRRLMDLAWQNRLRPMSIDLLLQFHAAATSGINDERYRPGKIRSSDDVWVEGRDGEKVHQPPLAEKLDGMLEQLINWINHPSEEGDTPGDYLHPVIKACIIHFAIGFLHPFHDGNGRVARALCYWQLFHAGYEAFRYISVSQLLKAAPVQYGEAYLKTETDNQDVTYFVDYQCRILERAVQGLIEHATTTAARLREFETWMMMSGVRKKMSAVQQDIITRITLLPDEPLTVRDFAERSGISGAAVRTHLEKLAEVGVLDKQGGGGSRPVYYTPKKSLKKVREGLTRLLLEG